MNLSRLIRSTRLGVGGAVAVEFALVTPVLITVVLGAIDFGRLFVSTQSLVAGTRVGAEYARNSQTCKTGIQLLPSVSIAGACTTGIHQTMQNSLNFSPALTFPAPDVRLECYCDSDNARCDSTTWMPANFSCATVSPSRGFNQVYVRVTASQTVAAPYFPWPGFPTTLTSQTSLQIQ